MRTSSRLVALIGVASFVFAACGGSAATTAPVATPAPTAAPTAAPVATPAPTTAASAAPTATAAPTAAQANLKIGVVTDIGTLNDKGYNEYSFKGAQDGAALIGSAAPQSTVTTSSAPAALMLRKAAGLGP